MSIHQYSVSVLYVKEFFGPVLADLVNELKWGSKTLRMLSNAVNLPISVVKQGLSILINFDFVGCNCNHNSYEYSLHIENILLLSRYPKFIYIIRKKYGKETAAIVEELMLNGRMTRSNLISKIHRLFRGQISESSIGNLVRNLIDNDFIIPITSKTETENSKISSHYLELLNTGQCKENELRFKINFDRFFLVKRDEIFVDAVTRKIDPHAGVIMLKLLELSFLKSDMWRSSSHPIPVMQIREAIGNDSASSIALKYADQYLKAIEEDSSGFISKSANYADRIVVCFKEVVRKIISIFISKIIEQKFGLKAARVFRLVESKKYCELEQIQQLAMLPDKEARQIAYKLLEENFFHMQDLRKPSNDTLSSFGGNKAFFLFNANINMIVQMLLGQCCKSLYNLKLRANEEENKYMHIIEKKRQADLIVRKLKEEKINEDQILEVVDEILTPMEESLLNSALKLKKKIFLAEIQIDETIFLLQLYIRYYKPVANEAKTKQKNKK